jgi:hypothetical protein
VGESFTVRPALAGNGPALAALRAAWTDEWHGATVHRAGFGPVTSLLRTDLDPDGA